MDSCFAEYNIIVKMEFFDTMHVSRFFNVKKVSPTCRKTSVFNENGKKVS